MVIVIRVNSVQLRPPIQRGNHGAGGFHGSATVVAIAVPARGSLTLRDWAEAACDDSTAQVDRSQLCHQIALRLPTTTDRNAPPTSRTQKHTESAPGKHTREAHGAGSTRVAGARSGEHGSGQHAGTAAREAETRESGHGSAERGKAGHRNAGHRGRGSARGAGALGAGAVGAHSVGHGS